MFLFFNPTALFFSQSIGKGSVGIEGKREMSNILFSLNPNYQNVLLAFLIGHISMILITIFLINLLLLKYTNFTKKKDQKQSHSMATTTTNKHLNEKKKKSNLISNRKTTATVIEKEEQSHSVEECKWITNTIQSLILFLSHPTRLETFKLAMKEKFDLEERENSLVTDLQLVEVVVENVDQLKLGEFCYEPNDLDENYSRDSFSISCLISWLNCCKIVMKGSIKLVDFRPDLLVSLPIEFGCRIGELSGRLNGCFDGESGIFSVWMEDIEFGFEIEGVFGHRVKLTNPQKVCSFLEEKLRVLTIQLLTDGTTIKLFE